MSVVKVDRRIVHVLILVGVVFAAWVADACVAMHSEHKIAQEVKENSRLENSPQVYIGGTPYLLAAGSKEIPYLQVEALDRSGLLSDITRALSDQHVNILSANLSTQANRVAISKFTFEMGDASHLDHVMRAVRKVSGVFDVYRITGTGARADHRTTPEQVKPAASPAADEDE